MIKRAKVGPLLTQSLPCRCVRACESVSKARACVHGVVSVPRARRERSGNVSGQTPAAVQGPRPTREYLPHATKRRPSPADRLSRRGTFATTPGVHDVGSLRPAARSTTTTRDRRPAPPDGRQYRRPKDGCLSYGRSVTLGAPGTGPRSWRRERGRPASAGNNPAQSPTPYRERYALRQKIRYRRRWTGFGRPGVPGQYVVVFQSEHSQACVCRCLLPVDHSVDVPRHGVCLPVRRRARNALSSECACISCVSGVNLKFTCCGCYIFL